MTRLDVIDTAVKIGLGAAITVVGSWFSLWISARNDAKKEIRRRRLDVIQQSAIDFETQSAVFVKLYAAYSSCLIWHAHGDQEMSLRGMNETMALTEKDVGIALHHLHRLEAQLETVGCSKSSAAAMKYRLAVTDMQSAPRHIVHQVTLVPKREEFDAIGQRVAGTRAVFYSTLREEFSSI